MTCRLFRRRPPSASAEAIKAREEVAELKPRVESVVRERARLLGENNYAARIRALYLEGRA